MLFIFSEFQLGAPVTRSQMALTLEHLAKSNRQVKRRKGESTEHYLQRLTHVSVICQKIAQIVRPSSLLAFLTLPETP